MKTSEEMMEYFRAMPSKKKENPYWLFKDEPLSIVSTVDSATVDLCTLSALLKGVREFFRRYFESFRSEAQVLCVGPKDARKLSSIGVPKLMDGMIMSFDASVMVLPQDNSGGNSRISETFWQNEIMNRDIKPIARIHSHHVLNAYQSSTDYSTLNSGTLEMVMGKIYEEGLSICYWLDVPGTDTKAQTFLAQETEGSFEVSPYIFNGPRAAGLGTVK